MAKLALNDRVQLHPATDLWMSGDRYGEIVGFTRMGNARVLLDRSGKTACVHPRNLIPVRDAQLAAAVLRGLKGCSACCLDNLEEVERVHASVMAELEAIGIRSEVAS